MTSASPAIELHIPRLHDPVAGSRDIRPRKVAEWIEGLPLANLGETARQVYNALLEFNSLKIQPADRFTIMEQFRHTSQYITDSLKKHYVGQSFPLSAKNRKIAELSREICNQMAIGYKITLLDLQSNGKVDDKFITTVIHRALRYLGAVLLKTYQTYDPYPSGVWSEIHQLFLYAERLGNDMTPVVDTEYTLVEEASIADAYKQALLLALACPYRLRQGEVEQVSIALERWAHYTTLHHGVPDDLSSSMFVANLARDAAPTYLVLQTEKSLGDCRFLDPQGLTKVLREEMIQSRESGNGYSPVQSRNVSLDIMRRLMLAWGVIPKRRFNRIKKSATVMVAMGLSTAHHFINQEGGPEIGSPDFTRPAEFKSTPIASESGEAPPLWELKGDVVEWGKKEAAAGPAKTPGSHFNYHTWHMTNVSAGGYCLLWDNQSSTQAQVGELLCIQEQGNQEISHWGIGVVRWMKSTAGQGLELGIQMLAPNALAVATRIHSEKAQLGEYQRSLLLPQIKSINQPASLLLPSLNHQVGMAITINSQGQESQVRLTKLLENTGTFAQFHFTVLSADEQRKDNDTQDNTADFDSLWSSL